MKTLPRKQIEGRKRKAERFLRDVLDDPKRAVEMQVRASKSMRKGRKIQIAENPHGENVPKIRVFNPNRLFNPQQQRKQNPQAGRSDLLARIRELQEENDKLRDALDKVGELASAPEDGTDEDTDQLVDKLNGIIDTVEVLEEEQRAGNCP
jgi:hypothetical protein